MQYKMLFWGRFKFYEKGEDVASHLTDELLMYAELG